MENTEEKLKKIIICDDVSQTIWGYVVLHLYELDGSQTIVIRTEPRKSVKDFMQSEMVETTEEKNNNEH